MRRRDGWRMLGRAMGQLLASAITRPLETTWFCWYVIRWTRSRCPNCSNRLHDLDYDSRSGRIELRCTACRFARVLRGAPSAL
jgi:hypothetical protein